MARYVSAERLRLAIGTLSEFKQRVRAQYLQHLLPFLALKRHGVSPNAATPYEEQDDFDFWDSYFLVDPDSDTGRYYDPFAGIRRIASHPHSNVATARKGTFAGSWHAAEYYQDGEGATMWRLSADYLDIVRDKCLTRAHEFSPAPLYDLAAWLYRAVEFEDNVTAEDVLHRFVTEFNVSGEELGALFATALDDREGFFAETPVSRADVLALIGEPAPEQPNVVVVEATEFAPNATELSAGMSLPPGVVDQAVAALRSGNHLILAGPPGTGKSTLAALIAAAATQVGYISTYQTLTATADWTTFDTIGGYMPTPGGAGLEFHEGLILRMVRADGWAIIDELNRSNIDRAIGVLITLLSGAGPSWMAGHAARR